MEGSAPFPVGAMEIPSGQRPNVNTPEAASSPLAEVRAWPRSAQITVSILLAACLVLIIGRSFIQSLRAGPSTVPPQRVELNAATHAELMLLPGVGETLARRIIQVRERQGGFQSVDDLRGVAGVGPLTLERLRPWVFVTAEPITPRIEAKLPLAVEPSKRSTAKPSKASVLGSPIDVNAAQRAELMRIPGIGLVMSQRIVDERAKKTFATVDDLRRVRGIGAKTLEKIRPFVMVSAQDTELASNLGTGAP